jgi:hypothetical protein
MNSVTKPKPRNRTPDSLEHVLVMVSKAPLYKVEEDVFARFAKSVWYDTSRAKSKVQARLNDPVVPPLRKRRLLYLLDRLRRYPCLDDRRAGELQQFVRKWETQLVNAKPWRQSANHTKDKLAKQWGVDEDASRLFSSVLDYQTRHYVDEHHVKSGYKPLQQAVKASA